eukprot:466783_1
MFINDDYKYNAYKQNAVHNNNFKTIWYITDADLKQYHCSYAFSQSKLPFDKHNALRGSQAQMERILQSKKPIKYSIYRIIIDTSDYDQDIFFAIYHRDNNSKWQQITHLSMLGYSYSNHTAKKYNGTYAWKIPKKDTVYILDSRANEANSSIFYSKKTHSEYYDVVINKFFVTHLYENINTRYSAYEVLKTLNAIYKLFTHKQQLNWSYIEDIPVQSFILSLQSRITCIAWLVAWTPKKNYSCLISLFTILCIDHRDESMLLDDKLKIIYNKLKFDGKLIDLLRILLNDDMMLIDHIKYILLLERKRNLKTSSVKSYYYLLWYNLICGCTRHLTQISHKPLIQAVKEQITNCKLNLNDLLCVITLDQKIAGLIMTNKEFLLTDKLMNKVIECLKKMNDLKSRQKTFFTVIDTILWCSDLYSILTKYETFVFGYVIIETEYKIWLRFLRCLFWKIKNNHHELISFVLNKFCLQIRQISDQQKSNDLFTLYNEWTQFMNCLMIQNAILQNEFLMAEKRFIVICAAKLRLMKELRFKGYLYLWIGYFCSNELIEIFDINGFNLKILVAHFAEAVETERQNNTKMNALCQNYKQQSEVLIAENKLMSVTIRKFKNSNKTQEKTIVELNNKLKRYENELNEFREDNKRLKESKQTQEQVINEVNNKLKMYENKMYECEESNLKLGEECKEWKSKYDELYRIYNIDTKKYRNWNYENITDWILSLHEEYKIYENVLRCKLKQEQLTGLYLCDLTNDDLDRFGIKAFKHKKSIMNEIKKLDDNNNILNSHLENDKIEPEGFQNVTAYHK